MSAQKPSTSRRLTVPSPAVQTSPIGSEVATNKAGLGQVAGISRSGVDRLLKSGLGPRHFTIGGQVRFLWKDIYAWFDNVAAKGHVDVYPPEKLAALRAKRAAERKAKLKKPRGGLGAKVAP